MKGFYSEYWAFNSLAPINAPTSTARAFNVVTIWSTHGRFHAGPTTCTNTAKAGNAINATHFNALYALSGRRYLFSSPVSSSGFSPS